MLSEHELVRKVRDLYPRIREIESEILDLFNAKWGPCGRGPTGVQGENDLDHSINYLRSAANMLEAVGGGVTGPECPHAPLNEVEK